MNLAVSVLFHFLSAIVLNQKFLELALTAREYLSKLESGGWCNLNKFVLLLWFDQSHPSTTRPWSVHIIMLYIILIAKVLLLPNFFELVLLFGLLFFLYIITFMIFVRCYSFLLNYYLECYSFLLNHYFTLMITISFL